MLFPIFHLTTPDLWDAASAEAEFRAPSLATEGFIHASTAAQVEGSANRFFAGHATILVLQIDTTRLGSELRREHSAHSADPFPHIYGPIDRAAVVAVLTWDRGKDGAFHWPPGRP